MPDEVRRSVTLEDLEKCKWQEVLAIASEKECYQYSDLFTKKCRKAEAAGDRESTEAFALLHNLTSYRFMPGAVTEPFQPTFISGKHRSATPSDLTDEELATLRQLAPGIEDPEMRARVADTIWERDAKRDIKYAQIAIDSYLESARHLAQKPPEAGERVMLVYCIDRVERAMRLARMINDKARLGAVEAYADELFQPMAAELAPLTSRLADLLVEFRVGDPFKYASIAKDAAERAAARNGVQSAAWTGCSIRI